MKELAEKELSDIDDQKVTLMEQMQKIIGDPNEREWQTRSCLRSALASAGKRLRSLRKSLRRCT